MRNKFSQLILISRDSASWALHQYSRGMCETNSRASNSGPQDCEADALRQDQGHHKGNLRNRPI